MNNKNIPTPKQPRVKNLSITTLIFVTTLVNFSIKVSATELQVATIIERDQISTPIKATSAGKFIRYSTNQAPFIKRTEIVANEIKSLGKTRNEQILMNKKLAHAQTRSKQQKPLKQTNNNSTDVSSFVHKPRTQLAPHINADEFSIFSVDSYLLDDVDLDGYYQGFSVVFDADIFPSSYAEVYVELYLRHDGGPWVNYYSSDIFSLYGQSVDDEFEVATTLEQGFPSGFYEVLIDLYDANSHELVLSYSSDDNNALYGLALESSDYDTLYIDEIVMTEVEVIYSEGGSTSLLILLMGFMLCLTRYNITYPEIN